MNHVQNRLSTTNYFIINVRHDGSKRNSKDIRGLDFAVLTKFPPNEPRGVQSITMYSRASRSFSVTALPVVYVNTFVCKEAILQLIVRNDVNVPDQDLLCMIVRDDIKLGKWRTWTSTTKLNKGTSSVLYSREYILSTASPVTFIVPARTCPRELRTKLACFWRAWEPPV